MGDVLNVVNFKMTPALDTESIVTNAEKIHVLNHDVDMTCFMYKGNIKGSGIIESYVAAVFDDAVNYFFIISKDESQEIIAGEREYIDFGRTLIGIGNMLSAVYTSYKGVSSKADGMDKSPKTILQQYVCSLEEYGLVLTYSANTEGIGHPVIIFSKKDGSLIRGKYDRIIIGFEEFYELCDKIVKFYTNV